MFLAGMAQQSQLLENGLLCYSMSIFGYSQEKININYLCVKELFSLAWREYWKKGKTSGFNRKKEKSKTYLNVAAIVGQSNLLIIELAAC